jgi:pimeloyl-ACP methyl ester carboxylesterase
MPRRRQGSVPSLQHHKPSNRARVRIKGHTYWLGKWGSPEAQLAYNRLIAEYLATGRIENVRPDPASQPVTEVVVSPARPTVARQTPSLNERVTRSLLFHSRTPSETVRKFMSQVPEDSWRAGNEMNTLVPDAGAVRCKVTVIGGSDDFMASRASSEKTAAAYRTKAIYIDHCAHMVPLECDPVELSRIIMNEVSGSLCGCV